MIRRTFFVTFFITLSFFSYTQNGHTPLKCVGDIPEDFLKLSLDKYKKDISKISSVDSRRTKKEKKEFFMNTNYHLDRFLQSGNVLFGDNLTVYVNNVANNLLDKIDKKGLKKELRFYVVKTSQVNAFSTQQGMIFVTVGLLAQIENEAQLAFVLAHEISHYIEKHNIEGFLVTKELERVYNRGRENFEELVTSLSSFSQEQELEADKEGFKMFQKAGYNLNEVNNMMLVLQYSHLPFDDIKFDINFFNKDFYKLPKDKFDGKLEVEVLFDSEKEKDNEIVSTHPAIEKRIEEISKLMSEDIENDKNKNFLLDKDNFIQIQKIARLENLNLNLLSGEYVRVVYEGFLLKRKYKDNKYIDISIAKGLYGLSKVRTFYTVNDNDNFKEMVNDFEGESQVLYNLLLSKITPKELTILALKYILSVDEKSLDIYKEDLIFDLVKKHNLSIKSFSKKYVAPKVEKLLEKKDTIDYYKLSKIEKIKLKNKMIKSQKQNIYEYYDFAFVEEMKDENFIKIFKEVSKKEIKLTDKEKMDEMTFGEKLDFVKKRKKQMEKVKYLGLDKIIIIDPVYEMKNRENNKVLIKSEEKGIVNNKLLLNAAKKVDLETVLLCKEVYTSNSTSLLNDEATIKEWISEYSYYINYRMIPFTTGRMAELTERYNSNYVLLTGVETTKFHYNLSEMAVGVVLSMVVPFTPFILYQTFKNHYRSIHYNFLIDTKTMELVLTNYKVRNKRNKEYNSRSFLYDVMYQIKTNK